MRVYHRETQVYAALGWAYPVPTATTIVRTVAGVVVEPLAGVYNAALHRLYVDTTNPLYASGTLYLIDWTIVIAGVPYATRDYYVHYTPTTGDVTGPGAPGVGTPTVSDSSATFPHVPPTDADYASTIIYCIPTSGPVVTGTGSGTSITAPGLAAGIHYDWVAVAYDTVGNPSVPAAGVLGGFATLPGAMPDKALVVKWWVSDEDDYHEFGPVYLPADQPGSPHVGSEFAPLGRGSMLRVRVECHDPVWADLRGMIVRLDEPEDLPGNVGERTRVV